MKFRLLLLLFSVLAIHAFARAEQPCLRVNEIWSSQDSLRQGSSFDMEILMTLDRSTGCKSLRQVKLDRQANGSANGPQTDAGLAIGTAQLVEGDSHDGGKRQDITVKLKIEAMPDLHVGDYNIPATVRYEALRQDRESIVGEVTVSLPIHVVDEHAHVKQNLHSPLDNK